MEKLSKSDLLYTNVSNRQKRRKKRTIETLITTKKARLLGLLDISKRERNLEYVTLTLTPTPVHKNHLLHECCFTWEWRQCFRTEEMEKGRERGRESPLLFSAGLRVSKVCFLKVGRLGKKNRGSYQYLFASAYCGPWLFETIVLPEL